MTEQITEIDTLVVGAGQAGVAMSEHLTHHGIPHLVLEKRRIAEAWRSGRWDSLVTNGPAWHDRFPGMIFPDCDADSFVAKEQIADSFAAYAKTFNASIQTGVEVFSAERLSGRSGFRVETSQGTIEAQRIVVATGTFQRPVIPTIVPQDTEGGLFDEAGVATLICGPGSMEQGHKADEYISILQTERCMAMLENICAWMRVNPSDSLT